MFRQKISLFILSVAFVMEYAQAYEATDTIIQSTRPPEKEKFNWTQLIAPASLITVGGIGVKNGWFKSINEDIRDDMSHMRGDCYLHADDYMQYLPALGYVSIGFINGNPGRHSLKERLCAGVTAYTAMALITNLTKVLVKEHRPDSGARNSFPSGHTATAFTGAELMRLEYGPWIGLGGYAVAAGVGFLRLYNNRHWFNDVLAGAGVGILSAHIGYWLLPFERRLFRIKPKYDMTILPAVSSGQMYGLTLVATF